MKEQWKLCALWFPDLQQHVLLTPCWRLCPCLCVSVDVSVSDFPRDLWSVGHHKQIDVGHDTQFEWQEHSSCYAWCLFMSAWRLSLCFLVPPQMLMWTAGRFLENPQRCSHRAWEWMLQGNCLFCCLQFCFFLAVDFLAEAWFILSYFQQ